MSKPRGPLGAAFLCLGLLLAPAAWGQSAPQPAARPAIDFAAELKAAEARLFLDPTDLQTQFTRGMLLAELGRYLEAADAFRRMLAQDPNLLRPRLELGRVLMLAKDYDGARYNFEQVLAHELPDGVRRTVLGVLSRIREELPSLTASIDIVFDSNANQATSVDEVEIDGVRYRLNADAREKSSTGVRVVLDGRVPIPNHSLWFVRGVVDHLEHDGKALDFSYLQASAGRHFKFADHTFTVELGHHWARYQNERLYDGANWTLSDFRVLRPDLSMKLALSGMRLDYPAYPYRDGWQHVAAATFIYAASPDSRWEMNLDYVDNGAKEDAYAFRLGQLGLRRVDEWGGGWITGVRVQAGQGRYQAPDPFFRETRRDTEARIEFDLLNRKIRIWKLSPRLHVGVIDRRSNIDFYAYRRGYMRLGLSGEF